MRDDLLPKSGTETSSYRLVIATALAPVLALAIILLGLIFVDEPRVREALITCLLTVVLPGIAAAGAVAWKYVDRRGDVSVAKIEAYSAINAPPQTGQSVTIEQTEGKS